MSDKDKVKIDQYADSLFKALGYNTEEDTHLCETYVKFKRVKDFLQPGKLTAEGYAMIVTMAELTRLEDGSLKSKKKPLKNEKKVSKAEAKSDTVQTSETDDTETPDNPFEDG